MAYSMNYLDDLTSFYSEVEDEFYALQLALNTITDAELPFGALDTQHFDTTPVVGGYLQTVSTTLITVDEGAGDDQTTWPPVLSEWYEGAEAPVSPSWSATGDYQILHVSANANLADCQNAIADPDETYALIAIAVEQGGTYRIVPRTVRAFSIKDRRVGGSERSDIDMAVSTMLRDGDLPAAGVVTGVRIVYSINNGLGGTPAYTTYDVEAENISYKTLRAGDLGG